MSRPDWMEDALCARTALDVHFPASGDHATAQLARTVCRACKVTDACLAYALARPGLDGIWGDTTAKQRDGMRRAAA